MSFGDTDQALWDEDPYEYIRRSQDIEYAFRDPRVSAINLLVDLVAKRRRHCFRKLMAFFSQVLGEYRAVPGGPAAAAQNVALCRRKEGVLLCLGALAEPVATSSTFGPAVEQMLAEHVLPDFGSPHAFLRLRACWVFEQFSRNDEFEYKNNAFLQAVVQTMPVSTPLYPSLHDLSLSLSRCV